MESFEASEGEFDRIIAIETFHNVKNYDAMFERCTARLSSPIDCTTRSLHIHWFIYLVTHFII